MRCRIQFVALLIVPILAGCNKQDDSAAAASAAPVAKAVAPDLKAIAQSVVTRSLGVKEGDLVVISGSPRDLELMENLIIEVRKHGAHTLPLLSSERVSRLSYDDVPEKYDAVADKWSNVVSQYLTGTIDIDASETPDLLAHVPASRLAARRAANVGSAQTLIKRKVRAVIIGNDMYPTHARAARYGLSRDQLASVFWSALNADFSDINANAKAVKDAIGEAKELHITDPNGTDLRVGITRKKWFISDGVMTAEGVAAGDFYRYLPAGEVFTLIDPSTAEGTIVADRYYYQSKTLENFTLKISKGKVVSMTAKSGIEPLQKAYDAEKTPGKDIVSVIDFGLNPGITVAEAPDIRTFIPAGTVTITTGNDTWAGGTNYSGFGVTPFLVKATVKTDAGKVIIENGVIKK